MKNFLNNPIIWQLFIFGFLVYLIVHNLKRFGLIDYDLNKRNEEIRKNNLILSEFYKLQLNPNATVDGLFGDTNGKYPTKTEINKYIKLINLNDREHLYDVFSLIPTQFHISVLANQYYKSSKIHLAEKFKNLFTTNERLNIFDMVKQKPFK